MKNIEAMYEQASSLCKRRNVIVSFEANGVKFTITPHRLGKKVSSLQDDIIRLLRAVAEVCDYDWSDNDEDAVKAIERLRSVATTKSDNQS